MKKKIENFEDVQLLARSFYNSALTDEILGPYFTHVATHHWDQHLELLDRFWNNVIFYVGDYDGKPLETHKAVHHFKSLNKEAFERWLQLFNATVDELFEGEKAALLKQRAKAISTVMQVKILPKEQEEEVEAGSESL